MKKLLLALLVGIGSCTPALALNAPDTPVVTGPNFQQVPATQMMVTPNGGTQTTLGAALANSGGVVPNAPVLAGVSNALTPATTSGSGAVALTTSPTIATPTLTGTTTTAGINDSAGINTAASTGFSQYGVPLITSSTSPLVTVAATLLIGQGTGVSLPANDSNQVYIGAGAGATFNALGMESTLVGWFACHYCLSSGGGAVTAMGDGATWHEVGGQELVAIGADDMRNTTNIQRGVGVGRGAFRNCFGCFENTDIGHKAGNGAAATVAIGGTLTTGDTLPIIFTDSTLSGGAVTITYTVGSTDTFANLPARVVAAIGLLSDGASGFTSVVTAPTAGPAIIGIDHAGNNTIAGGGSATLTVTGGTVGGAGTETITVTNGTVGHDNTAVGAFSMQGTAMTSAAGDIAVGAFSAPSLSTGNADNCIGVNTCSLLNVGAGNNIMGGNAFIVATVANFDNIYGNDCARTMTGSTNSIFGDCSTSNGFITSGGANLLLGPNVEVASATGNGQLSVQNAIFGGNNIATLTNVSTGHICFYEMTCADGTVEFNASVVGVGATGGGQGPGTGNFTALYINGSLLGGGGYAGVYGISVSSSATVPSGGTGNAAGDILTLADGCSTHGTITVKTVSSGAVTGYIVSNPGSCAAIPAQPVAVTSSTGSGTGATFNLVYGPLAAGLLAPSTSGNLVNFWLANQGPAAGYIGSSSILIGAGTGVTLTGASTGVTSVGFQACGGVSGGTLTIASVDCFGDGAGKALQGTAQPFTNIAIFGTNSLAAQAQSVRSIAGFGSNTFLNLNTAAGAANLSALGTAACSGASGATFSAGVCLGTLTGQILSSATNFVLIGPNVGSTVFASGSNVVLVGTNNSCTTAAAGTSNFIGLCGGGAPVISVTGANTPSTSATTIAGTLNVVGAFSQNGTTISPNLSGTTGSIGGGALLAGACTSGTVAVTGSTTAMAVAATPVTYPGDGAYWMGYVSTAGTVTVKLCAAVALTPGASTYNVRVLQ